MKKVAAMLLAAVLLLSAFTISVHADTVSEKYSAELLEKLAAMTDDEKVEVLVGLSYRFGDSQAAYEAAAAETGLDRSSLKDTDDIKDYYRAWRSAMAESKKATALAIMAKMGVTFDDVTEAQEWNEDNISVLGVPNRYRLSKAQIAAVADVDEVVAIELYTGQFDADDDADDDTKPVDENGGEGYYLVGTMTDWQINANYRLSLDPSNAEEYLLHHVYLATSDAFKVAYSADGTAVTELFPAGTGNNCSLATQDIYTDGFVDIRFRPEMDGGDEWYFGCILEKMIETPEPQPTENEIIGGGDTIDGGYYVVFQNDMEISEYYRLNYEFGRFAIHDITMSTSTPFKIAYSRDLETVTTLYPAGEDDYYIPRYNSRWYTVEFSPDGNNGGDSSDMGWYDGYVRAYPCEPPQEDSTEVVPVTDKEMKVNLYADAFSAAYPRVQHGCTYDELYYHQNEWNYTDWVLVQTASLVPVEGDAYGVFDEIVLYNAEYYPFNFGYGVYDVRQNTFHSITAAWNMGYEGLHDVFVHIARNHANTDLLGDVDLDDELTIIDATWIQRSLAGLAKLDDCSWWFKHFGSSFGTSLTTLADYDANGECDIVDVTKIQRHLVGMSIYPHDFTMSVELEKDGDTVKAVASTSFGDGPVRYCYWIRGGVHAYSVYGDDLGAFTDEIPEDMWMPGEQYFTTGYIDNNIVEIPVKALTYDDDFDLWVTAKDARGNTAQVAELTFRNVY